LKEEDWDPTKSYSRQQNCLRYSIEWKLTLNNKPIAKESEPHVVVAPDCFWRKVLQDKFDQAVRRNFSPHRQLYHKNTAVGVCVSQRSQPPLNKQYDEAEIERADIEDRLLECRPYFQKGKRMWVNISFNFVEPNPQSASRSARRGDKRVSTTATGRMLVERDQEIITVQRESGRPPIWPGMYAFMRCLKQSCDFGPHCWVDSDGKHHKMRDAHLKFLEAHIAQHGMPETHHDVPLSLQQQLMADEGERRDRKRQRGPNSDSGLPPINIVLPNDLQKLSQPGSEQGPTKSGHLSDAAKLMLVDINGFLDDMLRDYAAWQQSRVRDPARKAEIGKALNVLLDHNFDLGLIFEDQNPEFLVQAGVLLGTARRFYCRGDILKVMNMNKRPRLDLDDEDHEVRHGQDRLTEDGGHAL
jgi:hypothetical protein